MNEVNRRFRFLSFLFRFFLLLSLGLPFCLSLQARELNYLEAHLLRLSSAKNSHEWVVPFTDISATFSSRQLSLSASFNPYFQKLFENFKGEGLYEREGEDETQFTQSKLNQIYGHPVEASTKIAFQDTFSWRGHKIQQSLSWEKGMIGVVRDRVFPELDLLYFNSLTFGTAFPYQLPIQKKFLLVPQFHYGLRRTLDYSFDVATIFLSTRGRDNEQEKIEWKIKKRPRFFFAEGGLHSQYEADYFFLLLEVNSLPLLQKQFDYWETKIALRSKNLFSFASGPWRFGEKLDFSLGFSPFYGGNYERRRTLKLTSHLLLNQYLSLDLFLEDKPYLGAYLNLHMQPLELAFFTLERSYDDFHIHRSRLYGLDLRARF